MADQTAKKNSRYFRMLSHPIRREILLLIHQKGSASFSDLDTKFRLEVGTLYYHLKIMKELIQQDENRLYYLTDQGREAFQLITQMTFPDSIDAVEPESLQTRILDIIVLTPLLLRLLKKPKETLVLAGLLTLALTVPSFFTGVYPELLFYRPVQTGSAFSMIFWVALRWFYVYAILQNLCRWIFSRRQNALLLLSILPFTLLPLSLFPLLWPIIQTIVGGYNPYLDLTLQIILQFWSLASISKALMLTKNLRIERAALCALLVQYCNVLLIWLIGLFV